MPSSCENDRMPPIEGCSSIIGELVNADIKSPDNPPPITMFSSFKLRILKSIFNQKAVATPCDGGYSLFIIGNSCK